MLLSSTEYSVSRSSEVHRITDFVDTGDMTPEMYPDIGSPIGAVVVGYTEDERNQIWLSVKPSVLQKALVHLKVPATSERS